MNKIIPNSLPKNIQWKYISIFLKDKEECPEASDLYLSKNPETKTSREVQFEAPNCNCQVMINMLCVERRNLQKDLLKFLKMQSKLSAKFWNEKTEIEEIFKKKFQPLLIEFSIFQEFFVKKLSDGK